MKLLTTLVISMSLFGFLANAEPLKVGADAPRIAAVDQDSKLVNLGDIYEKGTTLVYFYPKAGTAGCTAQACSLRDAFGALKTDGITVIGVSKDTPAAQKEFREKQNLPFTLLADTDGKVTAAFGVPTMPVVGLASRQSFLIKDGKVVWHTASAQTKGHAAEVQKAIDSLK